MLSSRCMLTLLPAFEESCLYFVLLSAYLDPDELDWKILPKGQIHNSRAYPCDCDALTYVCH
jgi:hypothetical protein